MSIVDKFEQGVDPAGGGDECSPFGIERPVEKANWSGWITVVEYKPVGGAMMPVEKEVFAGFFGRLHPDFINNNK